MEPSRVGLLHALLERNQSPPSSLMSSSQRQPGGPGEADHRVEAFIILGSTEETEAESGHSAASQPGQRQSRAHAPGFWSVSLCTNHFSAPKSKQITQWGFLVHFVHIVLIFLFCAWISWNILRFLCDLYAISTLKCQRTASAQCVGGKHPLHVSPLRCWGLPSHMVTWTLVEPVPRGISLPGVLKASLVPSRTSQCLSPGELWQNKT